MFQVSVITKEGLSALAGCLNGKKLILTNFEYGDGVLDCIINSKNEEELREELSSLKMSDSVLKNKKCNLSIYEAKKTNSNLKVTGIISPKEIEEVGDFYAKEAALYANYEGSKILFAFFTSVTNYNGVEKDESTLVNKNIVKSTPFFFVTNFTLKDSDKLNIDYDTSSGFSLPRIDVEKIEDGYNLNIKNGMLKEDYEEGEDFLDVEVVTIHNGEKGEKGDIGEPFYFSNRYASSSELNVEDDTPENGYAIIGERDPENEKGDVYKKILNENGEYEYEYVTNLAGPKGDTGDTAEISYLMNIIYPVGSVYMTFDDNWKSPVASWEWVRMPSGYMMQQADYEEGKNSIGVGDLVEEGIPDIKGDMFNISHTWGSYGEASGAISKEKTGTVDIFEGDAKEKRSAGRAQFSASKGEYHGIDENGDPIYEARVYGKSEHVQPRAVKINIWKRIK